MLFAILFSILFGSMHCFPDAKAVAEMSTGPTVVTPLGHIQGTTMKSLLGKTIFAFRGIPYAKPPVGELRFKPPESIDKWNTTLDATKDGFACPQPTSDPVSDDCLVLNVYSTLLPKSDKNPKRPVIVFFHAGGFYGVSGQSVWQGPQYFMDREIVLVTPNYRLASLGFLSTGDKEAPGNNGLKDQVQVLKWVKQNIEAFGGDPDLVTIAGYSAGAVSVTLHMVSPMSRGLFHRAIAMSGSIVGNWKIPTNQLDLAKKQARLVGCPDTNSTEIINCLKTKSADEIGQSFKGFHEWDIHPILKWIPVIEPDFGQERFLTEDPNDLFQKGKTAQVPFMTGITTYEFGGLAYDIVANETLRNDINNDFERLAPIVFHYERDTERSKQITKELRKFYFDDKPIDNTTVTSLAEMFADELGFNVYRAANIVSSTNNNPVYYYKFAYKGRYSHYHLPNTNDTLGPVHHDDGIYLFYVSKLFPMFKESDPEAKIVDRMTSMWANFARTGNPTPEAPELWKPYTTDNKKYLNIDNNLSMEDGLYARRYEEWNKLFPVKEHHHHKHDATHANFNG